jgi:hypothetical protein
MRVIFVCNTGIDTLILFSFSHTIIFYIKHDFNALLLWISQHGAERGSCTHTKNSFLNCSLHNVGLSRLSLASISIASLRTTFPCGLFHPLRGQEESNPYTANNQGITF